MLRYPGCITAGCCLPVRHLSSAKAKAFFLISWKCNPDLQLPFQPSLLPLISNLSKPSNLMKLIRELHFVRVNFTHFFFYREALPLLRVWESFQRLIRVKVPHEGSHWGEAVPLHRVWEEFQEIVAALHPSEGNFVLQEKFAHGQFYNAKSRIRRLHILIIKLMLFCITFSRCTRVSGPSSVPTVL